MCSRRIASSACAVGSPGAPTGLPRRRALCIALGAALLALLASASAARAAEPPATDRSAAEAGGGEHGATHPAQVNHLDNWFHFSFGPGKAVQNGPLAFAILNFVLLVWLVVRFGRKPLREYLQQRHSSIKRDLEEAAALHQAARRKLEEIEAKLRGLDQEIVAIRESVRQDAELEKGRIIQQAEAEAQRLVAQADQALEKDLRQARRRLAVEAVDVALKAAEQIIRREVNDGDRQRLADEYFAQLARGATAEQAEQAEQAGGPSGFTPLGGSGDAGRSQNPGERN